MFLKFFINSEIGIIISIILVFIIIWVGIIGTVFGFLWTYSINFWLTFMEKPKRISFFWEGWLLGCIPGVGQLGLPISVVTFILSFFL